MSKIVGIHGIAQTFVGAPQLGQDWFLALSTGLEEAGGPAISAAALSMVAFGALFREPGARSGAQVSEEDTMGAQEAKLVELWWQEAARCSLNSDGSESAEATDIQHPAFVGRARIPEGIQQGLKQLANSKFFHALGGGRTVRAMVKQAALFLEDEKIKEAILERVAEKVSSETRILIGHSLGSVVAYEALCKNPQWNITTLITLGSPLGIPGVIFDALTPRPQNGKGQWPGRVRRWVNVADAGDIVAMEKTLAPLFGNVQDLLVNNGWHSHDVRRYLSAREVGEVLKSTLAESD